MKNVNVVIMGKTGVGKSTLVNAVFKRKLAKTGVGAAITIKNEKYNNRVYFRGQPIDLTGIVKKCAVGEYPKSEIDRYQAP